MNILVAPNAFKNSLTADKVAEAISLGLQQSRLQCNIHCFPIGDGGDGTAHLLIQHLHGDVITTLIQDPINRTINSSFGFMARDRTAIIELADASGLKLLSKEEYDPLHATTYGTGEQIKIALENGAKKIILCIGGSATVDGGVGILRALGIKFLDKKRNELEQLPASLELLNDIDTIFLDKRISETEIIILCDVNNRLLGEKGAAFIFGPQKGASKQDVLLLEECLTRFRDIALMETGKDMAILKHGGAAGGVSAGLHTFLNATLTNGIEYFLDITNFDMALTDADLVITGEGSIDMQTLEGKGPYGVARRAKEKSLPVIGLAGTIPLDANEELNKYFDELISINNETTEIKTAMEFTYANLMRTAKDLGDKLALIKK